jgi:molybdopterin-guanine dinucleotide biosynthesis protein A
MPVQSLAATHITGVILAGGEARRMGGRDKGLVEVAGRPMIEYVLEALRPQVKTVMINANRNAGFYARYGVPVIADALAGFNGPLAGMASGMHAARTPMIITVPCDSPFVPNDLVQRLAAAKQDATAEIAVAHNGERMQPVFALLDTALLDSLEEFLGRGERKIDRWFAERRSTSVDFSDRPETFINVNTPEEASRVEAMIGNGNANEI